MSSRRYHTVYVVHRYRGLTQAVRSRLPDVQVKEVDLDENGYLSEPELTEVRQNAEIILTESSVIADLIYNSHKLIWAQSMFAGINEVIERLDPTKPNPKIVLTRSPKAYTESIAQYVLSQILSTERRLPQMYLEQQQHVWNDEHFYNTSRLLAELRIGIIGAGEIGTEICKICKSVGMEVWGFSRTAKPVGSNICEYDLHMTPEDLPRLLESCDYICNVLPSTPDTIGLLSGDMLSHCRNKKSVFINVGRGDVVNEESLVAAISNKWISAAVLDVFQTEPLPPESRLWSFPNIYITPHTSGQMRIDVIAELFVRNYNKFMKGKPLDYEVNWEIGY